jgi:hypothetical protein
LDEVVVGNSITTSFFCVERIEFGVEYNVQKMLSQRLLIDNQNNHTIFSKDKKIFFIFAILV